MTSPSSNVAKHSSSTTRSRAVPVACLLLAITVVAYLPALEGGFVFDDGLYLTQDVRMESLAGLGEIWTQVGGPQYRHQYYPLTGTAFWLQHRLWGDNPFGYHFVNVLLHAANALLLWRLLWVLGIPGAWVAAAIFAVHPVNVQSVAWISELKNVLSTLFFLLSTLVFVRFLGVADARPLPRETGHRWRLYGLGLALFVCALASKTATCLLPVALGFILFWKRDRISRRDLAALAPLVLLGLAFVGLTVFLESHHYAHGEEFSQSFIERVLIAGRAVWFYAGKLLWPHPLSFIYPRWEVDAAVWWQYLYPLGVACVLGGLWVMRTRIGKAPLAAVAFFVVAVAPISFVNVAFTRMSYVADHWQYWASMGLITLAVAVASRGGAVLLGARTRRWALAGTATTVVAVGSGLTWQRGRDYESSATLMSDTIAKNPQAWQAYYNLGVALAAEGRLEEATARYHEALRLKPDYAAARVNLGTVLQAQGKLQEAIDHYFEALKFKPNYALAHYNLGGAFRSLGQLDEAIMHYQRVGELSGGSAATHNNLGEVLHAGGRLDEALAQYRLALEFDPDSALAHYNLAVSLRSRERLAEAIHHYRRALQAAPDAPEVHGNLGEALKRQGSLDEAVRHLRRALEIDPDVAAAHYNLAIVLRSQGRFEEAIDHLLETARLAPDSGEVHNSLGEALNENGRLADAIDHFCRAIELVPDHAVAHINLALALSAPEVEREDSTRRATEGHGEKFVGPAPK